MGKEKGGFLTPKAIANRIKSKGLQKLRWYCQMCQKQCRDENGFKCHCMSESHQRQLLLAGESPAQFHNFFSDEFLKDFMQLLKTRFGTKRVQSNVVYNEYISFKEHIHMNATKWETLTGFIKWLGREGYCKVDQTEKGWFIQYIDRDPMVLARQKELEKQKARERDDEERHARNIEEMVRKGLEKTDGEVKVEFTELKRTNDDEKVAFKFSASSTEKSSASSSSSMSSSFKSQMAKRKTSSTEEQSKNKKQKKTSSLHNIVAQEKAAREAQERASMSWIRCGIVVKVITKRLGDKYHKKKGTIVDVKERFTATVKMLNSGDKIRVDQTHLETVLPTFGKKVVILRGEHKGEIAVMKAVNVDKFCAEVEICTGKHSGRVVKGIKYEDISKKADPE